MPVKLLKSSDICADKGIHDLIFNGRRFPPHVNRSEGGFCANINKRFLCAALDGLLYFFSNQLADSFSISANRRQPRRESTASFIVREDNASSLLSDA